MRKTLEYTVPGVRSDAHGQRDNGKTFLLTEMPADQAERWFVRLLLGSKLGGVELPANWREAPASVVASLGADLLSSVSYAVAEPLLAEMMGCVQYVTGTPNVPPQAILNGNASQIEEITTRVRLRFKLFELHTGFSLPEMPQISG